MALLPVLMTALFCTLELMLQLLRTLGLISRFDQPQSTQTQILHRIHWWQPTVPLPAPVIVLGSGRSPRDHVHLLEVPLHLNILVAIIVKVKLAAVDSHVFGIGRKINTPLEIGWRSEELGL